MSLKGKAPLLRLLLISAIILLIFLFMQPYLVYEYISHLAILFPKGIIGIEELDLLLIIQLLMLLVVLPVYFLTFVFSWWYRAGHLKAIYDPDLVDNKIAEYIWWGLPLVMTLLIAILTVYKTDQLDPFKPIQSDKKPVTIQVVALQWKWLFLYPEEGVASVNFFQFPEKTPINFEITADAPMNSFWIPRLGGQIYAMPSMKTKLHLMANEAREYRGSSANLSGEGFASMHFIAKASSDEDYKRWLEEAKKAGHTLNKDEYNELAKPSQNNPVATYQLSDENLFNQIIMKYMHPSP